MDVVDQHEQRPIRGSRLEEPAERPLDFAPLDERSLAKCREDPAGVRLAREEPFGRAELSQDLEQRKQRRALRGTTAARRRGGRAWGGAGSELTRETRLPDSRVSDQHWAADDAPQSDRREFGLETFQLRTASDQRSVEAARERLGVRI